MSAESLYCERIDGLEETVAMLRLSNAEMSETLVQMRKEMDELKDQIKNMQTNAFGSVDVLQDYMAFQQQRMAGLNSKLLDKMTQMKKTVNKQRASIDELKPTSMKQSVSKRELTRQRNDANISNVELGHMAAEHQRPSTYKRESQDALSVSSATSSTSPATTTVLPTNLSNYIDPFVSDTTTAPPNVSDEKKTDPLYSNITFAANATTQASFALPTVPTVSAGCKEVLSEELFHAARSGNAEKIRQLEAEGATFLYRDQYHLTALHRAAGRDHVNAVKTLVELGAPLEVEDNNKGRPLHYAALYECDDCVMVLLSAGANVNARDKNGDTPLHLAAVQESRSIVEMLIAAGADRGVRDKDGKLPKDYACSSTLHALL